MQEKELRDLIQQGEGVSIEFKKSTSEITKDVYDTVCSFSNRDGGRIFLGVQDDGSISGVDPEAIPRMKKDFVTAVNNSQKLYPPLYLELEQYELDGKQILSIYVPSGSQVDAIIKVDTER
jgi:ATP-dependent DNA helicase RecG